MQLKAFGRRDGGESGGGGGGGGRGAQGGGVVKWVWGFFDSFRRRQFEK